MSREACDEENKRPNLGVTVNQYKVNTDELYSNLVRGLRKSKGEKKMNEKEEINKLKLVSKEQEAEITDLKEHVVNLSRLLVKMLKRSMEGGKDAKI